MIVSRTQEGREAAMDNGVVMGKPKREDEEMQMAIELYKKGGISADKISKMTGVGRATIFRRIKELKEKGLY